MLTIEIEGRKYSLAFSLQDLICPFLVLNEQKETVGSWYFNKSELDDFEYDACGIHFETKNPQVPPSILLTDSRHTEETSLPMFLTDDPFEISC